MFIQEEMEWLDITDNDISEHTVQTKYSRVLYKYGIGISYEHVRSGVIWADCLLGDSSEKTGNQLFANYHFKIV